MKIITNEKLKLLNRLESNELIKNTESMEIYEYINILEIVVEKLYDCIKTSMDPYQSLKEILLEQEKNN